MESKSPNRYVAMIVGLLLATLTAVGTVDPLPHGVGLWLQR